MERSAESDLASENVKSETSAEEAEEAEKGMEGVGASDPGAETCEAKMSAVYREKGEKLYLLEE